MSLDKNRESVREQKAIRLQKDQRNMLLAEQYIYDENLLLVEEDMDHSYQIYHNLYDLIDHIGLPFMDIKSKGSPSAFFDFLMSFNKQREVIVNPYEIISDLDED